MRGRRAKDGIGGLSVVVITGASQGIGAGYRGLGYAVVANSRNVTPSDDPMDTMRWPKGIR